MKYAIDTEKLKLNLEDRPDESEKFTDPLSKLKNTSKGMRYLFDKVISPMMQKKTVCSSDLDMSSFDFDDIADVCSFYEENFSSGSEEIRALQRFLTTFCTSKPLQSSVNYL